MCFATAGRFTCHTSSVTAWDSAAARRLDSIVTRLRTEGVAGALAADAHRVWQFNLKRYEPTEIGDTPQSLGFTCAANLREQILQRSAAGGFAETVRVSEPDGSLLVRVGDVGVQVMKAPPSRERLPRWSAFSWAEADSRARWRAAGRNSLAYLPVESDQDGRAHPLGSAETPLWGPSADASTLCDAIVVWSADHDSRLTAGWVGLPSAESPPWFAVASLWWDEDDGRSWGDTRSGGDQGGGDRGSFADRLDPDLNLGLRRRPRGQKAE